MRKKKNISLDTIDKKLPFMVPDNYFEDFAAKMEMNISKAKPKHKIRTWVYAVAAVFIGVIVLGSVYTGIFKNNTALKSDNYESYVLSQVDEPSMMYYYLGEQNTKK